MTCTLQECMMSYPAGEVEAVIQEGKICVERVEGDVRMVVELGTTNSSLKLDRLFVVQPVCLNVHWLG